MILLIAVYLKALGLALNFVGALILIIGTIKTDRQIKAETGPTIIKNKAAQKFMIKARTISIIGLILISVGFFSQLVGIFFDLYL